MRQEKKVVLYPHSRRRRARFLLCPLTLRDHPSSAVGKRIQRWLEWATWEEQWNPQLERWEAMHWLDLRDDIPDVGYMYIYSPEHGPLPK
jgi:hypothetical protein